ncbi:MAG: hypothetical protein JXK93_00710 [Sphaerochaetaceae bacterium]|nr:hypothetical protein [Sphaerochaetaceae bacterium]
MKSGNVKAFIMLIAVICVIVFFALIHKSFLSIENIEEVIMRVSVLAPIALGIMVVLIVKGIDLSPGTSIGLLGILAASLIEKGSPLVGGLLFALLFALIIGSLNGLLIARFNMNPFITTLAMMFIGMSMEKVLTQGGLPIYLYGDSSGFDQLYRMSIVGIPLPIIIFVVTSAGLYLLLEYTTYGRRLYASGMSIKGAVNAGIPVRTYFASAYIISSLLVFFSSMFIASKVRSGQPLVGQSYLWDAIGAAYLSTILSETKRPNVMGTILGVVLLAVITNGLTMLGLAFYWKTFARGFLILFVLLASTMDSRPAWMKKREKGVEAV